MPSCPSCAALNPDEARACSRCGTPFVSPYLALGTKLLNGRYSIGKPLGRGGFSLTYRGADIMLKRPVALKELFPEGSSRHLQHVIPPESIRDFPALKARFVTEARTLAGFVHPAIMGVYDVFEENGSAYLVMEYLEGETLFERLEREGKLSVGTVLPLARTLAEGLGVVHAAGLLHRDIKPANIFLTREGRAVLIDFGSARGYRVGETMRHTQLLTPAYAPPEQYAQAARFAPYTDLYSLGATLYHALQGEAPAPATERILGEALEPLPPSLPAGLREAITQALALRMRERPADVQAFLKLLDRGAAKGGAKPPSNRASKPKDVKARLRELEAELEAERRAEPAASLTPPLVLRGHTDGVRSVCFSPDGYTLASGAEDGTVRLWAATSGGALGVLPGHLGVVNSVLFSPDGSLLASRSKDGELRLWEGDAAGYRSRILSPKHAPGLVQTVQDYAVVIDSLAFSPDGRTLASGRGNSIDLYDLSSLERPRSLVGHPNSVTSLAFSPDGRLLASSDGGWFSSSTLKVWDVAGQKLIKTLPGHARAVDALRFSPDGSLLASGGIDGVVRLWQVQGLTLEAERFGDGQGVRTLAFHPDGRTLASAGDDARVTLWEVSSGRVTGRLEGHASFINSLSFSGDGSLIASGSDDHTLRLWQLPAGS